MNEMIERVAKVLAMRLRGHETDWKDYETDARAAILAMRDPADWMLEATAPFPAHLNYEVINREQMVAATMADQLAIRSHWQTMIDAALDKTLLA